MRSAKFNPSTVLLVTGDLAIDESVFYFIGRQPCNDTLFLLMKRGSRPQIFVSELEYGNYCKMEDVAVRKLNRQAIESELKSVRGLIGINFSRVSLSQLQRLKKYTKARFVDISGEIGERRAIKSGEEIKKIRSACRITQEIFDSVPDMLAKSRTEQELALHMELAARRCGTNLAFPVIVASGRSSSIPHYEPQNKKIASGFLIVDFGVKFEGYCSDMTRTFFIGHPGEQHENIFSCVMKAKAAAETLCVAGTLASGIHLAAEDIIFNELKQKMMHSIGHGLGLLTHDFPQGLYAGAKFKLKENMVVTIEPGYYGKEGGVRVEDDVVVKKKKCLHLSRAPKDLVRL